MIQDIFIIDEEESLIDKINDKFKNENQFKFSKIRTKELDIALRNIPSLLIINEDTINEDISLLCKKIRDNEDNSITPIIVVSSNKDKAHRVDILKSEVEYYIVMPIDDDYLYYTIKNIVRLMYTNRRVSPLTRITRKRTDTSRNEKKIIK